MLPSTDNAPVTAVHQRLICIGVLVAFDLFAGWIVVSMAIQ